jgi:ABC-type lipoprotein release transport system permease subunit
LLLSVVREACVYVVCSLAIGLPAAQALGSWLKPFLFGVTPLDVPAIAGACALLAATAVIAAWIPARRASGVDPLTALRYE